MKRLRRWTAGTLGLTSLLAAPLASSESHGVELGERIPYSVVAEYQSCVPDLPFRVPTKDTPGVDEGKSAVDEYFSLHPKKSLLSAWIATESSYDPLAVSEASAAGLGQLIPRTARAMNLRTATVDELSCLTGLDDSLSYNKLLRGARDMTRDGELPYEVLSFVHEPFAMDKNLESSYQYLEEVGFGRVSDRLAFMRYHAGPSLSKAGPRTRAYPDKIFGLVE